MPGTFFGLEIARRGVNVHRTAMAVTAHNITNAGTPGYSRQTAVIEASEPWTLPDVATKMQPGQLGTGVKADTVRRIRDNYLDIQFRQSSSIEGYWEKKLELAKQMEAVFPEPEGRGVQAVMLDFFNNWQDLNNNPQDPGVKKAVMESGDELATVFRQMYSQLNSIGGGFTEDIKGQVTQVNQLLTGIADISNAIINVTRNGAQANDLWDKRDNLLDQLAKITHIDVVAQDNGLIDVTFMGITVLKDDGTGKVCASQLTLNTGAGAGGDENHLSVDGDDVINLTALANYSPGAPADAGKGTMLGTESARLENKNLLAMLNNLAVAVIDNVNQKSGLPGSPPATTTIKFFDGSSAADMSLSDEIRSNPDAIIGENALAVAQLQSTMLEVGTVKTTPGNYYRGIVAQVGASADHHSNMLENQHAISQQISALKQSVSGVNVDEELTMVMQFQYGYQASARMISMQDDMLDYLINRI